MKCKKCGREIGADLKFCKYCGAPVTSLDTSSPDSDMIKCNACGALVKKGVAFCTQCGNPVNNIKPVGADIRGTKGQKKKQRKLGLVLIIIMTFISLLLIGGIILYFVGADNLFSMFRKETPVELGVIESSTEESSEMNGSESETEELPDFITNDNEIDLTVATIDNACESITKDIVAGIYSSLEIDTGIIVYSDNDSVVEISARQNSGDPDYSRNFYYEEGKLVYAEYAGTDKHGFYFDNDAMVRWSYFQDAKAAGNQINYDGENTSMYIERDALVRKDSEDLVAKFIDAKQKTELAENTPAVSETLTESESDALQPFYGIWLAASKSESEINKLAQTAKNAGIDAKVFVTTDWSNLNSEKYYVITAGTYETEEDAKNALSTVKGKGYKGAYVKYSGSHK